LHAQASPTPAVLVAPLAAASPSVGWDRLLRSSGLELSCPGWGPADTPLTQARTDDGARSRLLRWRTPGKATTALPPSPRLPKKH